MAGIKNAVITNACCITALGNLHETWEGLCSGKSGIISCDFTTAGQWPAGVITTVNAPLGSAERIVEIMRLGLSPLKKLHLPSNTPLVLATTKGAVNELNREIHPFDIPCQPWNLSTICSAYTGHSGPAFTVSGACASGTIAIIQACQMVLSGSAEIVTAAGIDILSDFVQTGFASLQALSRQPCRPFDRNRDGLSTGEAAGAIVVASEEYAVKNKMPVKAYITGVAASCDAIHITAPCREGSGLTTVLKKLSNTLPEQRPGAVNAHGTGTVFNDAMEIAAFQRTWDIPPPFHSIKGSTGHCLGAAGIIETATAVISLEKGVIPPTTGFGKFSLEHAETGMKISGKSLLELEYPSIISCNSGFGGINAGIAMRL